MALMGTYDFRLVGLSIVIATFASFAALDLAGRITASNRRARIFWLTGGATALGLGIWSMHYIGMLAFRMPMTVFYDVPTVVVSLLAAIVASGSALFTVSRRQMSAAQLVVGSAVMGSGIAAMHYIGMAAMRMPATVHYSPLLVSLSIALAMIISFVALVLAFRNRADTQASPRKILSALVMGSAIPIMHYTGMWAATFSPSDGPMDLSRAVSISSLGIAVISVSTLFILSLVIASAFLDRMLSAQKEVTEAARKAEEYFRTLAEDIPTILWTTRPDGQVDFCNRRWLEYTGQTAEQGFGEGWTKAIHPDDLLASTQEWRHAVETGDGYKAEYRLRGIADGSYRWHLARALPVRGPDGEVVKWFGACTDIDDQKRNQETLEAEVLRRTEQLVEANAKLKQEMAERERTQLELDAKTAHLVEELTDRSAKSGLLAKMSELLHSCNLENEAFSIVLGVAPKMFPGLGGAIILLNSSKNLLEVAGLWGECYLPLDVFEPTSCWALRTGHRHSVEADERVAPCGHAKGVEGAYVCIPIQAHGDALGVIHFQALSIGRTFTEQEQALAGTFAEQIGLSIANIRLREALRNQSIRDAVTGLYNRRYLEETLDREIHRAIRKKQPLGVIMFDIDNFKAFNDSFGHDAGDAVLQSMGVSLSRSTRADDVACRYGGEEFVLILPNASLKSTGARAERLRQSVRELTVTHLGKPLGTVTISAGVAALPEHGSSAVELLAKADDALYRAKKLGRDRVSVAGTNETNELTEISSVGHRDD
jgi:diguanylate cyclase (GGDEF)-like protein/PAS domain S-box-containing protein